MIRMLKKYFSINRTRCLVLHPVAYPNKGPLSEQYLAEEAIGLITSLGWQVSRGPFWHHQSIKITDLPIHQNYLFVQDKGNNQVQSFKDGQYISTSLGKGVVHKDGVIFDADQSESDGNLYHEWKNKNLRQSLGTSTLVKTKRITRKLYFTKGKVQIIASHLKQNPSEAVFINAQLKPIQIKNLQKIIEARINNLETPKGYFVNSLQAQSETQIESQNQLEKFKGDKSQFRKIKIFDRFSIILQIFAQRSSSKISKLQIQLSYLNYLKTRLVRSGTIYSANWNLAVGDLMKATEINMQVVSAKQRKTANTMSGEGQSQLQLERRNIKDKQAEIRKKIQQYNKKRNNQQSSRENKHNQIPVIALVGYTNVGKSALLNKLMKNNQVQSKDILFQTLSTTSRQYLLILLRIVMPSGRRASFLDTIGFITNLPVQLVESFKSTLEQIKHADLVVHMRDISNPQNELQKQSIVQILNQLNLGAKFKQKHMLQVWNKIDLMETQQNLNHADEIQNTAYQISCETGQGVRQLLKVIDEKMKEIQKLSRYRIQYPFQKHYKLCDWIKSHTNISYEIEYIHNYETNNLYPKGSVIAQFETDLITYKKIDRYLYPAKNKIEKGMPPKDDW